MCILPSSSEAAAAAEVAAAEVTGKERAEGAVVTDPYVTELPDSFEDSIARMGKGTLQAMDEVCRNMGVGEMEGGRGGREGNGVTLLRGGEDSVAVCSRLFI